MNFLEEKLISEFKYLKYYYKAKEFEIVLSFKFSQEN